MRTSLVSWLRSRIVTVALLMGTAGCGEEPVSTEPLVYAEPQVPEIRLTSLESRLSSVRLAVRLERSADRGGSDDYRWGAHSQRSSGPRPLFGGLGQPILLKPESMGWTKWFEQWARRVVIASERSVSSDPTDPLLEIVVKDLWLDTSPERCRSYLVLHVIEAEEWEWQDEGSVSCWVNPKGPGGAEVTGARRTYRGYGEAHMNASEILGQRLRDWLQKSYVDRVDESKPTE